MKLSVLLAMGNRPKSWLSDSSVCETDHAVVCGTFDERTWVVSCGKYT